MKKTWIAFGNECTLVGERQTRWHLWERSNRTEAFWNWFHVGAAGYKQSSRKMGLFGEKKKDPKEQVSGHLISVISQSKTIHTLCPYCLEILKWKWCFATQILTTIICSSNTACWTFFVFFENKTAIFVPPNRADIEFDTVQVCTSIGKRIDADDCRGKRFHVGRFQIVDRVCQLPSHCRWKNGHLRWGRKATKLTGKLMVRRRSLINMSDTNAQSVRFVSR